MAYDYFETVKEDAIRYLTAHPMKYEDYEDDPLNVVEYLMYKSEVTHYSEEYTEEAKKCIIDNFPLLVETYTYGKGTSSLVEDLEDHNWSGMDYEIRYYALESVIDRMYTSGEIDEYIDYSEDTSNHGFIGDDF